MAVTRAETSEFGRASAGEASVVLMVYGSSGLLFVMPAIDRNAVAWLWPARLIPPDALRVFISVFGQSAMRPCAGPAGGGGRGPPRGVPPPAGAVVWGEE